MLATYVALHDITDVEGFVANSLERSDIKFDTAEKEELLAEGICILLELSEKFEPHRAGYATSGRFSGFAAQFLPRRLGDAWHSRHPEHRRIAGEDGKRRWTYQQAPVSLDALTCSTDTTAESFEISIRPSSQWAPIPVR